MSGDGGDGLNVSKETLAQITTGLQEAINELKQSGSTGQTAQMGSGIEELSLTNMQAGHAGLADDFNDFCENWEWGVRALMADANAIAERLGLAVGLQYEQDKYWEETFKGALHSANPLSNPGATEEEINGKGWTALASPESPDYSEESTAKAREEISGLWANPEGIDKAWEPGGDR